MFQRHKVKQTWDWVTIIMHYTFVLSAQTHLFFFSFINKFNALKRIKHLVKSCTLGDHPNMELKLGSYKLCQSLLTVYWSDVLINKIVKKTLRLLQHTTVACHTNNFYSISIHAFPQHTCVHDNTPHFKIFSKDNFSNLNKQCTDCQHIWQHTVPRMSNSNNN